MILYFHFCRPVAASSAMTLRLGGAISVQPLPTKNLPGSRSGNFTRRKLCEDLVLSVAGMKMELRFVVKSRALPVCSAADTRSCTASGSWTPSTNPTGSAVLSDRARSPSHVDKRDPRQKFSRRPIQHIIKSVSVRPTDHLVDFAVDWKIRKHGDLGWSPSHAHRAA